MEFPRMIPIRQHFVSKPLADIPATVRAEFQRSGVLSRVKPGEKVAITAGSRGIANFLTIVRAVVDEFKKVGAQPFVVPTMGSHGGATAEGQVQVLSHYGFSQESLGCPILSTMEVEEVGRSPEGIIAFVDKNALAADHIVVLNRIKPHTDFEGNIESGLCKMMCIGLGKHQGALHYHQAGINFGFEHALRTGSRLVMEKTPILCGVGIVEDGYDQTAIIEVLTPDRLIAREEELLAIARQWVPRLPFRTADVLIVDRIGKNISGAGMDTKVIGRIMSPYSGQPEWPKITRIVALDVTDEAEGNCIGVGNADFTTRRLVEKIDRAKTYVNALTAQCPNAARIPPYYDTDTEALEQCFSTIGLVEPARAKVIHIQNTLHLEDVHVSEAYLEELKGRNDLEVTGPAEPLRFDDRGYLIPV